MQYYINTSIVYKMNYRSVKLFETGIIDFWNGLKFKCIIQVGSLLWREGKQMYSEEIQGFSAVEEVINNESQWEQVNIKVIKSSFIFIMIGSIISFMVFFFELIFNFSLKIF